MGIKIKNGINFSQIGKQLEQAIKQQNEKMNMQLGKNHIKVLEELRKNHDIENPPTGMTQAQLTSCLRDMDGIYTRTAFTEGGGFCAVRLLDKGEAYLDDLIQERREKLQNRLSTHTGYDENEIAVWVWLSDNKEHFDAPEDIDYDDFYAIMEDMISSGYVKEPLTKDNGYKLTLKGKRQIEAWVQEKLPDNPIKNNEDRNTITSSNLRIKEKCKTDIIKIFYGIQKCGLIEKEDGSKATIEDVMNVAAQMLNDESLKGKRYSSLLSEAAKNNKVTFLSIFDNLRHNLECYYDKHNDKE